MSFRISGTIESPPIVPRLELLDNVGTAFLDQGQLPAVALFSVDWDELRIVEVVAASNETFQLIWLYCTNGTLFGGYSESLVAPLQFFDVQQPPSCDLVSGAHDIPGTVLSGFSGVPSDYVPVTGVEISGAPLVSLGFLGTGSIVLDAQTWSLTAFGLVDCTDCGQPGWYEVHAVLAGANGETGIVFLYLMLDDSESVFAAYGVRLDRLQALHDARLPAHWSWSGPTPDAGVVLRAVGRTRAWTGLPPRPE